MRAFPLALCLFSLGLTIKPVVAQEFTLPAMDHLKNSETFQAAKFIAAEKKQIFEQAEQSSFDVPDSWESELRVRRVVLGGNESLVVQGTKLLCGGTGNCQTWIFRKTAGKWVSTFSEEAPIASGFGFTEIISYGLPELVVGGHVNADTSFYALFSFDGSFYRETRCFHGSSGTKKVGTLNQIPCKSTSEHNQ